MKVLSDLEEFEVIETALVGFEFSLHRFDLSPDIDKGFRVSCSRNAGILKVCKHAMEFRTHEKIHILLEMPRVSPPILLS